MDTSSPMRRQPLKSAGSLAPPTSRPDSAAAPSPKQDVSGGESEGAEQPSSPGDGSPRRGSIKSAIKRRLSSASKKSQKSGGVDTTHDAMGSKWPKGMWDNTESKLLMNIGKRGDNNGGKLLHGRRRSNN